MVLWTLSSAEFMKRNVGHNKWFTPLPFFYDSFLNNSSNPHTYKKEEKGVNLRYGSFYWPILPNFFLEIFHSKHSTRNWSVGTTTTMAAWPRYQYRFCSAGARYHTSVHEQRAMGQRVCYPSHPPQPLPWSFRSHLLSFLTEPCF